MQHARLPDDAPQILIQDTIELDDESLAWTQVQHQRRTICEGLVNKLYSQIRYGCQDPQCKTSICLTCRKRVSKKPLRNFTDRSARTLALTLASQAHAEDYLCDRPYTQERKNTDKDFQRAKTEGIPIRSVSNPDGPVTIVFPSSLASHSGREHEKPGGSSIHRADSNVRTSSTKLKDPQSLSQAILDTPSLKNFYKRSSFGGSPLLPPVNAGTDAGIDRSAAASKLRPGSAQAQRSNGQPNGPESIQASLPSQPSKFTGKTWARLRLQYEKNVWTVYLKELIHEFGGQTHIPPERIRKARIKAEVAAEHLLLRQDRQIWQLQQTVTSVAAAMPIFTGSGDKGSPGLGENHKDAFERSRTISNATQRPQTLSRFSEKNVKALMKFTLAKDGQLLKDHRYRIRFGGTMPSHDKFDINANAASSIGSSLPFAHQSMSYILSTPRALLSSFKIDVSDGKGNISHVSVAFNRVVQSFHWLRKLEPNPQIVFPSLKRASMSLYASPPSSSRQKNDRRLQGSGLPSTLHKLYQVENDREAAHMAHIIFAALVASIPSCSASTWRLVQDCHNNGRMGAFQNCDPLEAGTLESVLDAYDDEVALDLLSNFVNALSTRLAATETTIDENFDQEDDEDDEDKDSYIMKFAPVLKLFWDGVLAAEPRPFSYTKTQGDTAGAELRWAYDIAPSDRSDSKDSPEYIEIIIEWLKVLIVKEWDGKVEIERSSMAGGALEILSWSHDQLCTSARIFQMPHLAARLDSGNIDVEWFTMGRRTKFRHLLTYPFLLSLSSQVCCFRGTNYAKMLKAYKKSIVASRLLAQMSPSNAMSGRDEVGLHERLGSMLQGYFVIEVRRHCVLEDAMDQLWRSEKRELMKPLKVRMGMDEGEEGLDHGGVQQEFFRIAIAEAFDPKYGLFSVTDEQSGMMWFQPCSQEPLWKYEMIGLLFSLAIYNGLTLPVNLPLAFYSKLQGYGDEVSTPNGIRDGWPVLARGLQSLLDWSDGDVADVFARSYEYTIEMPGQNLTVDMQKIGRNDHWMPAHLNPESAYVGDCTCGACSSLPDCANHIVRRCHIIKPGVTVWVDVKDMPCSSPEPISQTCLDGAETEESASAPKDIANEMTSPREPEVIATSFKESGDKDESESLNRKSGEEVHTNATLPSRPASLPLLSKSGMVTNDNREEYVSDYIHWLTEKSIGSESTSFIKGFNTCIDCRTLILFDDLELKMLVEGTQDIRVEDLRRIASYEGGWDAEHRTIQAFWRTIEDFSPHQLKLLMEFVTASDRLPITGMRNMTFSLQKNGDSDDRLPTSLTCYGRLLLPAYSSQEVLKEKLCLAIENSKGFGVA
ncbi:MAG: hypothetical protein Q9222_002498 [Ikaeria aurantiellina]